MDNDIKIIKKLKKAIKNLSITWQYRDKGIPLDEKGNALIANIVLSGKPFAVMRIGAVEARCIVPWMRGEVPTDEILRRGKDAAGIFPANREGNAKFSKVYTETLKSADILGVWDVHQERKIIDTYCPQAQLIRARSIESYYYDEPWTKALAGKKLLVVHPFVDSIEKQFEKRTMLFGKEVLPRELQLRTVKAVQSNAGGQTQYASWLDSLRGMEEAISKVDFDIAIIGAGAYGLPLAAFCKGLGKQAVQMSGATQILFGIKGKRWDEHPVISKFYNEYWVRPSIQETPPQIEKVEGGSYW